MTTSPATHPQLLAGFEAGHVPAGVTGHVHHWLIATPQGPECEARCACGAERTFSSGMTAYDDPLDTRAVWRNMTIAPREVYRGG